MIYYAVLIDEALPTKQIKRLTEAPAPVLVVPHFSAQYCDENGAWQVPCAVFKLMMVKQGKSRNVYYYYKVQNESAA